jgi:hypothetical protein
MPPLTTMLPVNPRHSCVAAATDRGDADEVTPIAASAQDKIARGEFSLALVKGRRLVHRTMGHRETDEIPIRHAQHAANVSGGK